MVKLTKENFNSDGGYITAFDVNIGKITREVNDAIQEAVQYIDSGDSYPTWYWELGHDDEKMWCLVLGFMDGYEPNENEFTDSYGQTLALKWGAISNRSSMYEFDMDFEMPYDEETGDVLDSCTAITSFDASSDVKYEIEDFYEFVKQYNASLGDDFDESFSKRKPSNRRSVRESRKPMSKSGMKISESSGYDGRREYWFDNLGYFDKRTIDAIKSVADGNTWMRFEVIASNYAGNYTLGVVAPDSESPDEVFTFFISYLLTKIHK